MSKNLRTLESIGEACRRLNPHLFGAIDPEAQTLLNQVPLQPKKKRIRQSSKPIMNQLETEFLTWLDQRTDTGVYPQSLRFKLGNGIWYKPDFIVFSQQGITAYEVKGKHAFRGGFENLKVAASKYPFVKWVLVWKGDMDWEMQTIMP